MRCTTILILSLCVFVASARTTDDTYLEYINKYSELAVDQQTQYGIPASITLAQGLLESAAGRSTLATQGNNHFGIKCHKDWEGETMLRDDDAPNECFRVYNTVEESFHDHSVFLTRKRYKPLFDYDISDYSSWAKGLSKCGYATDPNYATRLIAIIERYALYTFDTHAEAEAEEMTQFLWQQLRKTHPVRRSRGLHYVIAAPGDTYSGIAKEFHIKKKKLMAFNDAESDDVKEWQEVYLEEKLDEAPEGTSLVTIGEGESFHSLSQRFGMKLSVLQTLNPKAKDCPGERIRLR